MCLSTAYRTDGSEEYKIGEYISNMEINGDEISLTDIMGGITRIIGRLKKVDLEKNVIIIEADA